MFDDTIDPRRHRPAHHWGRGFDAGRAEERARGHHRGERGFGYGPGGPFWLGMRGMFGRGRPARRGDVRSAILALLAEKPMHGYQVMRELAERSGGEWQPSAGSVYPTLQQLEDEGLVRGEEREGRRVFTLTDDGQKAATRASEAGAPWETGRDPSAADLGRLAMQVARATMQVRQVGTAAAVAEAHRILVQARRDLYRLLAEDDLDRPEAEASPGQDEPAEADTPDLGG